MVSLPVYDRSGAEVATYQLDAASLAPRISKQLLHDVVIMYQANRRQGSAKTKSRAEVRGTTAKMYSMHAVNDVISRSLMAILKFPLMAQVPRKLVTPRATPT